MLPLSTTQIMSAKCKTEYFVKNTKSEKSLIKIFDISNNQKITKQQQYSTTIAVLNSSNSIKIKHKSNLTTLHNSNNTNKTNIDNENSNSSQNYSFSMKTKQICCKNAIKSQQKRATKLPSSPAFSSLASPSSSSKYSSAASLASSHSWILCLWLWLAISSLTFVHCIPSPSSSMQQLQKRGKCNKLIGISTF